MMEPNEDGVGRDGLNGNEILLRTGAESEGAIDPRERSGTTEIEPLTCAKAVVGRSDMAMKRRSIPFIV